MINPLYKSAEGQQAMTKWYDSLVGKFEVPCESLFVPTRFGNTHMFATGSLAAEPIILVQGLSASAPLWRYQLRDLGKQFRVYALDIVGQPGRSDPITPSFLDNSFSLWLQDVLDELDINRAHFGGISVGGWLAMRFGLFAPERVKKLFLSAPSGLKMARLPVKIWFNNWVRKPKEIDALADSLTAKSHSPKSKGGAYDQQIARAMALATKHYRVDRSLGIYNEKTGRVNFWAGLQVLRKFFLPMPDRELRGLKMPAFILLGENETLYSPHSAVKRVQRLIPNVQTRIFPNVGHTLLYDIPEEANALIADFLVKQ